MARRTLTPEESLSPNLIPMIDIMFLLLLFFMLGADMGQRELEDVRLPQADSARDDPGRQGRMVVNVHRDGEAWRTTVNGRDFQDPGQIDFTSTDRVLIRADESAPYGEVQRAMNACAKQRVFKIECGARK